MNSAHETLARDFGGVVIEPGSPEYASASGSVLRAGSPAYVLRPETVNDVVAAVAFAAGTGLPLSVRGGGHAFAGFATNDGGIVIDLRRLGTVELLDKDQHLVRVGGGATWGQVADLLAMHDLAISSGDTRGVGVGGLTLGGGIGWKVRKYGLALDALVGADLVTADGRVARASADEHPDLFWAIRGGGGNFGIVTSFDFRAHPTTDVFHGAIAFPAEQLSDLLPGWADVMRDAPAELSSIIEFANPFAGGPNAPVQVHVAFDGDDPQAAEQALAPIRRLGTPIDDTVGLKSYAELLVDAPVPPPGIRLAARNAFVDAGSVAEVLGILATVGSTEGSPFIAVRSLGGAVSATAGDATAYAYREAELMLVTTSIGPEPVLEAARPALDALWNELSPHVAGAYAGFQVSDTDRDVAAIYPHQTYQRLAGIKRRYDPDNLFARNHNVRP